MTKSKSIFCLALMLTTGLKAAELRKELESFRQTLPIPHYESGYHSSLYEFIERRWGFRPIPKEEKTEARDSKKPTESQRKRVEWVFGPSTFTTQKRQQFMYRKLLLSFLLVATHSLRAVERISKFPFIDRESLGFTGLTS